jgi:predicted peroxiredoxin
MSRLQGLTIVVAGADPARLHAALSLAAAWAAMDRRAHLFLQAEAVALLHRGDSVCDSRYRQAGLPTLRDLIGESLALGVAITACQSGLALAGLTTADLPEGVETGGLVELLASRRDDQLLMA